MTSGDIILYLLLSGIVVFLGLITWELRWWRQMHDELQAFIRKDDRYL
jgi:hypothetical protein